MVENNQELIEGQLQTEAVREELEAEEIESAEENTELAEAQQIEEEEYANQLAAEQESNLILEQAEKLYNQGMNFGNPSVTKWGIVFALAILNDVIDLLGVTGIGEIICWTISIALTVTILLILWFTDGDLKKAQRYAEDAGKIANQIELTSQVQQIESNVSGLAGGAIKRLNTIPGFKSLKLRETARKNPLTRVFIGSAIESIPFVGDLNLITVWVLFAYLAERSAHQEAREVAQAAYSQISVTASEMI